jgi:Uma2 family endonuclease
MRLAEGLPVREPDVMVVLNAHQDRVRPNYLDGAADVVMEIVSPESSRRDRGDKLSEYEAAAIPEYWLIDPLRTEAVVYALGDDGRYHPVPIRPDGRIESRLLPGFRLPVELFWREVPPSGVELLALAQAMVG